MNRAKKTALGVAAAGVLLTSASCSRKEPPVPQVASGTLERFPAFASAHIPPRTLSVWLPDGYVPGEELDVLYMHDGQMLFDPKTTWNHRAWEVDDVLGGLMAAGDIRRCMVVGIDNTRARLYEYFPDQMLPYLPEEERARINAAKFQGDAYLRFLVEEVKPFIDKQFQPAQGPEHTFICGSSMGGLISLYALCEYPAVFGGAACLSTHLTFAHMPYGKKADAWADAFRAYVRDHLTAPDTALLYMDHGTKGLDEAYGPDQEKMDAVILAHGWDSAHFKTSIYQGDDHNETCWSARLSVPLELFLGK